MSDVAVRAEGLAKAYRIGLREQMHDTMAEAMVSTLAAPFRNLRRLRSLDTTLGDVPGDDLIWALRDVTFDVKHGDAVAIIGRNGAGKSTLLKILSRITDPTSGWAGIRGRVSSLLEVGTGFHPELTGRENVYMNGTILGMRKREVDARFDEIVAFSGIERYIDTPIKRYSSGMKVRLAFSVAAHLDPDVLILDEVLAVGDFEFQRKCLGTMRQATDAGRTVLFVSHNLNAVQALCRRGILLDEGRIVADGDVESVVRRYVELVRPAATTSAQADVSAAPRAEAHFGSTARIGACMLYDAAGQPAGALRMGEPFTVEITGTAAEDVRNVIGILGIDSESHLRVASAVSSDVGVAVQLRAGQPFRISMRVDDLRLNAGWYWLTFVLRTAAGVLDRVEGILGLEVLEVPYQDRHAMRKVAGWVRFRPSWGAELPDSLTVSDAPQIDPPV